MLTVFFIISFSNINKYLSSPNITNVTKLFLIFSQLLLKIHLIDSASQIWFNNVFLCSRLGNF